MRRHLILNTFCAVSLPGYEPGYLILYSILIVLQIYILQAAIEFEFYIFINSA